MKPTTSTKSALNIAVESVRPKPEQPTDTADNCADLIAQLSRQIGQLKALTKPRKIRYDPLAWRSSTLCVSAGKLVLS